MAIGYDGGSYSGNLDEISRALGVEPDIEGVTSRLGTPVDRLGDATIIGSAGMPLEGGLTLAQSLASLARIDPQLVRDIMSGRTYMSGTGLLGEGDVEIHQDEEASDVKKAVDELDKSLENILPDTPLGTTDIFNAKTKMWEAVYDQLDRPEEFLQEAGMPGGIQSIDSPMWGGEMTKNVLTTTDLDHLTELVNANKVRDDILSGTQSFEVETPLGTTDIFDTETGEWTGLTDTQKAPFAGYPNQQGIGSDSPISPNTPDWAIERWWEDIERQAALNDLIDQEEKTTATPSIQDTQADVMDEGILAGLGITEEESHAKTRALNLANANKVEAELAAWKEYEANKQGASQQQFYDAMRTDEEESLTGYLEGLSPAMRNVLNNDPELMAQYMAARSSIIAQLNKTGYKEHEEFYPGSQAAATQAGFWGPMALGWNDKYNEYKDAQRELMGLQSGQRFMSGDWINNLGWMTPDQINRLAGYGEP